MVFSLVVISIEELSAMHSNGLSHRGIHRQCILNHNALGNGRSCTAFSLVRLSDMAVSIA